MKSRTSFFNATALRKNVTRFAPAWALYSVFLLLFLVMLLDVDRLGVWTAQNITYAIAPMAAINGLYAPLCAQLLFGDLYSSRMCNALHAMPMRREGWFAVNAASGVLFSLVPNLAVTVLSLPLVGGLWQVSLLWLAASTLQYLFFFGVAVLSCYLVGNRFAMVVVYGILNGISIIAYWLVHMLYAPLLYGVVINQDIFLLLCPVAQMCIAQYMDVDFTAYGSIITRGPELLILEGWGYLGICAALGVLCLALALLLYRRRALECAGDFMAVRSLGPVFLVLYTLCVGAVCQGFFYMFVGEEQLGYLIIGLIIGFFTGKMLLERTVRVIRKKTVLGFIALLAVFLGSLLLTQLDVLGIARWVPQVQQVQSVGVTTRSSWGEPLILTEPEDIETVLAVHRHGTQNRTAGENGKADVYLELTYTMKNGAEHCREYYIDVNNQAGQDLKALFNTPRAVLGVPVEELDTLVARLSSIQTEGMELTDKAQLKSLLQAVIADCEAGTIARDWNFYGDLQGTWLTLEWVDSETKLHRARDIRVYDLSQNTMAWLQANGCLPEYEEKYG